MDESQQIVEIAKNYFLQEYKSEEKAEEMMAALAGMVQEDGAKLVHLGNVLFLVMVRGKGVVEIHTIGNEDSPRALARDFVQLAQYLEKIDVKTAYTYTHDPRFEMVAKLTKLPIKGFKTDIGGESFDVYVMEL